MTAGVASQIESSHTIGLTSQSGPGFNAPYDIAIAPDGRMLAVAWDLRVAQVAGDLNGREIDLSWQETAVPTVAVRAVHARRERTPAYARHVRRRVTRRHQGRNKRNRKRWRRPAAHPRRCYSDSPTASSASALVP